MKIPKEFLKDFEAFPAVLRALLDAELAAGNRIAEIGHGFPAPPVGAWIKLAKPLASRPRVSGDGIDFYDRNMPSYSGEITDAKRFFFLLEPPHPPEPAPDMDAIRAAIQARQAAALADLLKPKASKPKPSKVKPSKAKKAPLKRVPAGSRRPKPAPKPKTIVDRFVESMEMNYEKWHDGTGYDISLIENATPQELVDLERFLVNRPVANWRDVEALASINSPRARLLLRKALKSKDSELRVAVTDYASDLVSKDERTDTLLAALEGSEIYGGLTQALLQVEEFHPPKIIDALFRGVLARDGGTAVHFAAMLMFTHGKAETSFDWDKRPFFLKFHTEVRAEREAAFRELCKKIGVKADKYVAAPRS
jgi:hypothetical protein